MKLNNTVNKALPDNGRRRGLAESAIAPLANLLLKEARKLRIPITVLVIGLALSRHTYSCKVLNSTRLGCRCESRVLSDCICLRLRQRHGDLQSRLLADPHVFRRTYKAD